MSTMHKATIKDIYAGKPDAKDELNIDSDQFFASFIMPPELPVDRLLDGSKYVILGYKGVGKTSVLYYLQNKILTDSPEACTSFLYFKSDYEEVRRSDMEMAARNLTAVIDASGECQPEKIEYFHIWRWVFFRKIVDDCEEFNRGLFVHDETWERFLKLVNRISFSSSDKKVLSLSSLSVSLQASTGQGLSAGIEAKYDYISKSGQAFREFIRVVDECENLFSKLTRTGTPYYIFVDEMEAYYGNNDIFIRDLTLIRDLIFTIHRINATGKVHIIAAVRNEIIYAMDRFIQTRELNKITDGFGVPIKWSYSTTNSYEHPIIRILMKRISLAEGGKEQDFRDWFPEEINNRDTVSYILDNGWNKPRDIVRFLIAAQNDSIHCNNRCFTQDTFASLRKEYSRNSLAEIRQELQSLYTSQEIEMVMNLLRGGLRIFYIDDIRKNAAKGSKARAFWEEHWEEIVKDYYRVGFWGNVNRHVTPINWRWNHKGDTGALINRNEWELAIHNALCSELSIVR